MRTRCYVILTWITSYIRHHSVACCRGPNLPRGRTPIWAGQGLELKVYKRTLECPLKCISTISIMMFVCLYYHLFSIFFV